MPKLAVWPNRDPIGEKWGANLYSYVHNSPVDHWDLYGLRTPNAPWGMAGKVQVSTSCRNCPQLIADWRYIPEDNPIDIFTGVMTFTLTPITPGSTYDADALYAPVGNAWKIGDPGQITVNCVCACARVELQATTLWLTENRGETLPSNWPGRNPIFSIYPQAFGTILLNGMAIY